MGVETHLAREEGRGPNEAPAQAERGRVPAGIVRPSRDAPTELVTAPPEALAAMALVFVAARWILQHAPNRAQRVPWTSPGPVVATLGILAATIGVGLYVRFSASLSVTVLLFGTAVVILLWLYLCFVALLWGAIVEADSRRRRDLRTRTSVGDRPPAP